MLQRPDTRTAAVRYLVPIVRLFVQGRSSALEAVDQG